MKKSHRIGIPLLILAAAFLVYAPALRNGFVWDDSALVLRDPLIRSWRLIAESFRHNLFLDATPSNFYRPMQRLLYTGNYALFAFRPWGWHLANILVHALAGIALWLLADEWLRRFAPQKKWWLATLVAVIWTVHPMFSEAVIYVAGVADPLAALFGFTALYLATRGRWWLAAPAFLAAMLSKESGMLFLPIWLAFLIWQKEWLRLRIWALLGALVAFVYAVLRLTAQSEPMPPHVAAPPLFTHLAMAARAFAEYAGLLAFPLHLQMERNVAPQAGQCAAECALTAIGILLAIALAFWFWRSRRSSPLAAFCLVAFAICYLPISNLLPLNASMAEHWFYVPAAFLLIAIAASLPASLSRAMLPLMAIWLVFIGARTWFQNGVWRDSETFFQNTIRDGGDTVRMEVSLAMEASLHHDFAAAETHFQKALAFDPKSSFAIYNLGSTYLFERNFAKAKVQFEKAKSFPLLRAKAVQSLGFVEEMQRHDASKLMLEAAQLAPDDWPIQKAYVQYFERQGNTIGAIRHLQKFMKRQSFRAESWHMMGDLLLKARDDVAARAMFARAAAYDVHDDAAKKWANAEEPLPQKDGH